jgi:hypothetical protein
VQAGFDGQFQLRADAIGGGDQQGIAETGGFQVEKCAESAQGRVGPRTCGGTSERLDRFDKGITCIDVDAGFLIGAMVLNGDFPVFDRLEGGAAMARCGNAGQ